MYAKCSTSYVLIRWLGDRLTSRVGPLAIEVSDLYCARLALVSRTTSQGRHNLPPLIPVSSPTCQGWPIIRLCSDGIPPCSFPFRNHLGASLANLSIQIVRGGLMRMLTSFQSADVWDVFHQPYLFGFCFNVLSGWRMVRLVETLRYLWHAPWFLFGA